MKIKKRILSVIIAMVMLMSGCTSVTEENTIPDDNKENNQVEESEKKFENKMTLGMDTPLTLNPLYNTKSSVEQILYLIFNPLINVEEDSS